MLRLRTRKCCTQRVQSLFELYSARTFDQHGIAFFHHSRKKVSRLDGVPRELQPCTIHSCFHGALEHFGRLALDRDAAAYSTLGDDYPYLKCWLLWSTGDGAEALRMVSTANGSEAASRV